MSKLGYLKASITAAVTVKPSTIYSVKVDNELNGRSWCIRKRYSDFFNLRSKLMDLFFEFKHMAKEFPFVFHRFPKRHRILGSRRSGIVKDRVKKLQYFLQDAIRLIEAKQISRWPPIYQAYVAGVEAFLGFTGEEDCDSNSNIPIQMNGRLLTDRSPLLHPNTYRYCKPENGGDRSACLKGLLNKSIYTWSIAGDAVGLWAASEREKCIKHLKFEQPFACNLSRGGEFPINSLELDALDLKEIILG